MHRHLTRWLLAAAFVLHGIAASAAEGQDAQGTHDHPEVPRFPGYFIEDGHDADYDEFSFSTDTGDVSKGGRLVRNTYIIKPGARQPTASELARNYENAFRKAGGTMVYKDLPVVAVFRMPLPSGGERWMQLDIDNNGTRYLANIVDTRPMKQTVELTADQMAEAIQSSGSVALQGILFATDEATIKPESLPLLKEIVGLLRKNPALKLLVVGHTDNVGQSASNLVLSRRRAESVVAHLVRSGVASSRLRADGKGDSVPLASNQDETGRAKNRRVEFVRQ